MLISSTLVIILKLSVWAYPLTEGQPISRIPDPDGLLHVFALPIGVGDCNVIQCPDGTLSIIDMGTSDLAPDRFWAQPQIREFLTGYYGSIQNIIITHWDFDHYVLFPGTLNDTAELSGLQNIYISCAAEHIPLSISNWLTEINAMNKIRYFNDGGRCGPFNGSCGLVDICPNNPDITLEVLGANLGQRCTTANIQNTESIVSKLTYNDFTMMLPGDLMDVTDVEGEEGPQKWLVDFYGPELEVTVYEVAYHGVSGLSNKQNWIQALAPTMIFSTADPWLLGNFPMCKVFDDLLALNTLCRPAVTDPADPEYCGDSTLDSPELSEILQTEYACGLNATTIEYRIGNQYALYTTTPDEYTIHIIDVSSDGMRYGLRYLNATIIRP